MVERNKINYVSESDVMEIKKNMDMKVTVPLDEFGNACTEDVTTGKTFSSSNGLNLTGTHVCGNVHITTLTIPVGRMRGDVNLDGAVDEKDAEPIRKHYNGHVKLEGLDLEAADADNSGMVNANDTTRVSMEPTKKYKLYNTSNDLMKNWIMREDYIAEPEGDYEWIFSAEVIVPGITPGSTVKITPKKFAEITRCGMNSEITLGEGCITFRTLRPPKENIECMVEIFENGDGSAVFTVPPTEREIEDTTAKNIVDGEAYGSLRTVGSAEQFDYGTDDEDEYYYIDKYAFAEGYETQASGLYSHAAGFGSKARGNCSFAEGRDTIADSRNQHVQGKYNIADKENKYAHIVGNGTNKMARSNAYTLDWAGNGAFAGRVTAGAAPVADMDLTTKQYVDNAIAEAIANLNK